jgi:putative toxin-antitoxin system antitoxin component (TIGR02293 family)
MRIYFRATGIGTAEMKMLHPRRDTIEGRLQIASHGTVRIFDGSTISDLAGYGVTTEEIYRFVAPRRTLARRIAKGEPLTVEENDSALRIVRIVEMAVRVFGEDTKALNWLRMPNRGMGGVVPIDLLESETGALLIEQALNQIDYGIYI